MCLDKIDAELERPIRHAMLGWKIFKVDECGNIRSPYRPMGKEIGDFVDQDVWLKAENKHVYNYLGLGVWLTYKAGFHYFVREGDAKRWGGLAVAGKKKVCIPVKVRNVRILGEQDGRKVNVADEMYVSSADVAEALRRFNGASV